PLSQADLADPAMRAAIAGLIGRLQREAGGFQHGLHPFAIADRYLALAPHPTLFRLRDQAQAIDWANENASVPLVPAHIDPNPTNFLFSANGHLHLIDWEFSAMADPCWDLAAIALEGELAAEPILDLLDAAGHVADQRMQRRIALFQCALCL